MSTTPDEWVPGFTNEQLWHRIAYQSGVLTEAEKAAETCSLLLRKREAVKRAIANPIPVEDAAKIRERCPFYTEEFQRKEWESHSKAVERYSESLAERTTPDVAELLKDGWEAFRERTVARVLRVHWVEVMNPCPRCGAPARTPQARQCPKCFYRWEDDKVSPDDRPAL